MPSEGTITEECVVKELDALAERAESEELTRKNRWRRGMSVSGPDKSIVLQVDKLINDLRSVNPNHPLVLEWDERI